MLKTLTIVDDFSPRAYEIRRLALQNDFGSQHYNGANYIGVGLQHQPDLVSEISEAVGFPITPVLSFFRLGLKDDKADHWIHADAIPAQWSGVFYLSHPSCCTGGTAFWRHKTLGWDHLQNPVMFDSMNEQGKNPALWDMTSLVGMKFNRFIAYPSSFFHSQYPLTKWGEDKRSGRLVMVVFFNAAEPRKPFLTGATEAEIERNYISDKQRFGFPNNMK